MGPALSRQDKRPPGKVSTVLQSQCNCYKGETHAPNANTGSVGWPASEARLRSDAAATESSALRPRSREASRARASGSPALAEHMDV
jgi:hypothetical protein